MVKSSEEAFQLLNQLDAPPRLILHAQLVSEVSMEVVEVFESYNLKFDKNFIEIGAILHDSGKIIYPEELEHPGSNHEEAGEKLLLENGVQQKIARVCNSHANWFTMDASFEELLIALADKLWKGKRDSELELQIIDKAAEKVGKERWDIFVDLDASFEQIASDGAKRLARSY